MCCPVLNTQPTVKAEDADAAAAETDDDDGEDASGSVPHAGSVGPDEDDEGNEEVQEEEEEEELKPSVDVITSVFFPDFVEKSAFRASNVFIIPV